ncbi:MAG: LptF/LptG family permease [Candidatus Eisenbacteria sp.]|nr:LptF/LptG family permease [Candidatus Eisenbacteria bacterium]
MGILGWYVLKEHIGPFVFALAVVLFVLVINFVLDYLELFIGRSVPPVVVLELFALSLGWMFALAVPMAVLIATIMAFGRLGADNETTAMKASGLSLLQMTFPLLGAAVLLTLALTLFNHFVLPEANHRLSNLLVAVHRKKPVLEIKPGVFSSPFKDLSILVDDVDDKTSTLRGVTIYRTHRTRPTQTILADRGRLVWSEDGNTLAIELFDGEIHEIDREEPDRYFRLSFGTHEIRIENAGSALVRTQREHRSDREMNITDLRAKVKSLEGQLEQSRQKAQSYVLRSIRSSLDTPGAPADSTTPNVQGLRKALKAEAGREIALRREINRYSVEFQKKFSIPFACIVFVILGAPLGARIRHGSFVIGLAVSAGFILFYYISLIGGEQLSDRRYLPPFWSMWAANIVLGILGVWVFVRAAREQPFVPEALGHLWRALRTRNRGTGPERETER